MTMGRMTAVLVLMVSACGGDSGATAPPPSGRLTITVATTGSPLTAGGYMVRVLPPGQTTTVGISDTLRLTDLAAGNYTVTLSGGAENCLVDGLATRVAVVQPDTEAVISFAVTCYEHAWQPQAIDTQLEVRVEFFDANTGVAHARGNPSQFFGTIDGGASWTRRAPPGLDGDIGALVEFHDAGLGVVGGAGLRIARTRDLGGSWDRQQLGSTGNYLLRAFFVDDAHGWVAGDGGYFFRTRDGGDAWVRGAVPTTQPIFGLFFSDTLNGVMTGASGRIYSTGNGGASWSSVSSPTGEHLQALAFADDSIGVAVGDLATIIRTVDGGATWTRVSIGLGEQLWRVDFGADGFGVAVGDGGLVLVTRDTGATWQREYSGVRATLSGVAVIDSTTAWVSGRGGVVLRRRR